jgi:hypothetical protein
MYVRTAPGIKIRDPDLLDFIPDEGREVPNSDFWHRRLRDGDVILGAPTPAVKSTERSDQK